MILTDKVTIKMNKNIKFCFERIIYNIYFYYYLDVHNYDEKSALISLKCKISGDVKSNKEYFILEFDEFEIPHELTVKQWITNLAFHYDPAFEPENLFFEHNEKLNNKVIDIATKDFKLKNF